MSGRRWMLGLAVVGLLAHGCAASDDAAGDSLADEMPDDLPPGSCGSSGTAGCETDGSTTSPPGTTAGGEESSTTSAVDGCAESDGCVGQGVCAAAWDADAEARGPFECQFACIPLLDDAAWCSDDASCCDAGARCTERGYCVLEDGSGGDEDAGSSSSSGGTTG